MVDEQSTDSPYKHSERYVDDPMNPEIKNCENENDCIDENEGMIAIVTPFFERLAFGFDMKIIEHQYSKWNGYVQRGYGVVKWVMCCIER